MATTTDASPVSFGHVALREAEFSDYPQIAEVTARCGLGIRAYEEWLHVWLKNPEYRHGWPIGWVLENRAGRIVGSFGNVPLRYELDGRSLLATASRSWAVEKEYRGYASLLLDEFFNQPGVDLYFNTTVNRHSVEALRTFDSAEVPRGQWDRSAFWITGYRGFAASALRAIGWKLAAPLSFPAGAALRVRDAIAEPRLAKTTIEVREENAFDDRFDAFWDELRTRRPPILLGARTRAALQWHFEYPLRRKQAWVLTVSHGSRLIAYSIFYREDQADIGLKRVRLVDRQCLVDSVAVPAPDAMLARMLEICRREGVHMLEDVGCTVDSVRAPHRRALPSWLFYYKASSRLTATLSDPALWRPSLFDGDSTL
jgi:hypothetical protein